jgi:hypothetical protein
MAAKTIVTSHPDVACDVCGRRLLRGERPDVFLGGGQRRMVCELCTPRATHEGWRREAGEQLAAPRGERPARGRSLLGRLRQLREPVGAEEQRGRRSAELPVAARRASGERDPAVADVDWDGIERALGGPRRVSAEPRRATHRLDRPTASDGTAPAPAIAASTEMRQALEVFNAGATPRRVAGIARSLGDPGVCVAAIEGAPGRIAVVLAWELCWYRYEVDLAEEEPAARLAAEGMELEELAPGERTANAAADAHGTLALQAS